MRALRLVEDRLELHEVPVPDVGPDDVLVKVAGAGVCHSDLHVVHIDGWPTDPMTLGHETAGHVAATGERVADLAEGDPVIVHLVWACGTCRQCREGRDNVCAIGTRTAMPPCPGLGPDGGMAEYLAVPARHLEPLGTLDPVTAGPLADAGVTSHHAIDGARHRLGAGSTAVVVGVGGLGHVALQILLATTPSRVVAVDASQDKLDLARQLGAHEVVAAADAVARVLELTDGYGADAVFDFVGTQPTLDLAASVIAPDGALRIVGLGGGELRIGADGDSSALPWGVEVRKSYGGTRSDLRAVLALAEEGRLEVRTRLYPLADGARAFEDLERGAVEGRAVLVP